MVNHYENVVIYTPVLSDDQLKDAIAKFKGIMTDGGAEIVHENSWGLRKLAYPIQKKSTGFYHVTEFKGSGDLIDKLEIEMKRDERVIRFLTVKLDKHAVEYNYKKRNNLMGKNLKSEPAKEEEAK